MLVSAGMATSVGNVPLEHTRRTLEMRPVIIVRLDSLPLSKELCFRNSVVNLFIHYLHPRLLACSSGYVLLKIEVNYLHTFSARISPSYIVVPCAPGFTLDGNICTKCPIGTFKSTFGKDSCTDCSEGFFTEIEGASSEGQCSEFY